MLKWLEAPHVKKWWDSNIVYSLDAVKEKYLRKNIASQAITNFLNLYGNTYSHIFVDPDLKNIPAIKAYRKANFKKTSVQKNSTNTSDLKQAMKA